MLFRDRRDAGRRLARRLKGYDQQSPLVLGLPRGGVAVAFEVARSLGAPLDIWGVRKLGAPIEPELGMGAIAEGGELYLDRRIVDLVGATEEEVAAVEAEQALELERRVQVFREGRPPPDVRGRTVILVDDGIATGATVRVAVRAVRKLGPAKLILAVPVAAPDTLASLRPELDEIVCLHAPPHLGAIGLFYSNFAQTSDEDVLALLRAARAAEEKKTAAAPPAPPPGAHAIERAVRISLDDAVLDGDLGVPEGATGLVLFAHGSGSSRHSPRNRFVAQALRAAGVGTLLFDLLTPEEEARDDVDGRLRFDVDLLARRLTGATRWVRRQETLRGLAIGYFGASTGAAAALVAAANEPEHVRAVVSRGGRPDLAGTALARVEAPTLLIVGAADVDVVALNEEAFEKLRCPKMIVVVPGATHLFSEPGALEEVAALAAQWLAERLAPEALRRTA